MKYSLNLLALQIPILGAVPDLANSVIDMFRAGVHHRKIRGRSGAQRALTSLALNHPTGTI